MTPPLSVATARSPETSTATATQRRGSERDRDSDSSAAAAAEGLPREAAILLISLDPPVASELLARLDRDALDRVSPAMARLGRVSAEERRAVLLDFAERIRAIAELRFEDLDAARDEDLRILVRHLAESIQEADVARGSESGETPIRRLWRGALVGTTPELRERLIRLGADYTEVAPIEIGTESGVALEWVERAREIVCDRFRQLAARGLARIDLPSGDSRRRIALKTVAGSDADEVAEPTTREPDSRSPDRSPEDAAREAVVS